MLGEALTKIHDFVWGEFCDWYIELAKIRLRNSSSSSPLPVLVDSLEIILRLLHPFMPFITEEIWQLLSAYQAKKTNSIMIAEYPVSDSLIIDEDAEHQMESVIEIIRSIRNARSEATVEPSKSIEANIFVEDCRYDLNNHASAISVLARVNPLTIAGKQKSTNTEKAKVLVLRDVEVILPLSGMVDKEAEYKRLQKEIETTANYLKNTEAKLQNQGFLSKAPPQVVEMEQKKLAEHKDKLERLKKQLGELE
jgi:valyl-tRNA synthetase